MEIKTRQAYRLLNLFGYTLLLRTVYVAECCCCEYQKSVHVNIWKRERADREMKLYGGAAIRRAKEEQERWDRERQEKLELNRRRQLEKSATYILYSRTQGFLQEEYNMQNINMLDGKRAVEWNTKLKEFKELEQNYREANSGMTLRQWFIKERLAQLQDMGIKERMLNVRIGMNAGDQPIGPVNYLGRHENMIYRLEESKDIFGDTQNVWFEDAFRVKLDNEIGYALEMFDVGNVLDDIKAIGFNDKREVVVVMHNGVKELLDIRLEIDGAEQTVYKLQKVESALTDLIKRYGSEKGNKDGEGEAVRSDILSWSDMQKSDNSRTRETATKQE